MSNEKKLNWFQLQWRNFYIQMFLIAAAFLSAEIILRDEFYSESGFYVGISIPIGIMALITWKGFIKFWHDYQNKK